MSKPQKRAIKTYTEEIYADKQREMWEMRERLYFHINIGKAIPAKFVENYFSCFVKYNPLENFFEVKKLIEKTLKYFSTAKSKKSGYNFSVKVVAPEVPFEISDLHNPSKNEDGNFFAPEKSTKLADGNRESIYSLAGLVEQIFIELNYGKNSETRKNKSKCLRFIFNKVSAYTDHFLKKKEGYSPYQKSVLSGFIAAQLDYLATPENYKDVDYNAYLYQQMKTYSKSPTRKTSLNPKPNSSGSMR